MRGVIKLPLEDGKQELNWYVGRANVQGTNEVNPTIQLRINRDADFVAKRMWVVQWPKPTTQDLALALPVTTSLLFRDGGTQRALSLLAGFSKAVSNDTAVERATKAWVGLPTPFLIRNNSNLFVEVTNPAAAGTAWEGDLFLITEGFKVYPGEPMDIPKTIESYSIPFGLNGNLALANPNTLASNISQQVVTVTNNGEGRFLAKAFNFQAIDANGVDRTDLLNAIMGFQLVDSTSGTKEWIQDQTRSQTITVCPAPILTMHGTFLPFNTPRLLDENAVVKVRVIFASDAASLALANTITYPLDITVNLEGSLLPR